MKRQILISTIILLSMQTLAAAAIRPVPQQYPTIQSAINASSNGDIIVVAPNPNPHYPVSYSGPGNVNLDFNGLAITVQSQINPDNPNPNIIANTIIDCGGQPFGPWGGDAGAANRAFWFHSGEDPNSKVLGFTIINGYTRGPKGADGAYGFDGSILSLFRPIYPDPEDIDESPPYALDGNDAMGNAYGGAILCGDPNVPAAWGSPTIQYCVIKDCTVTGAHGGRGADGLWGTWEHYTISDFNAVTGILDPNAEMTENPDGQWGGTGGRGIGNGYGGAIACLGGSSPIISDCNISNNTARGGRGGDGGSGGYAAEPPNYSDGLASNGGDANDSIGDGIGGAIYAENGSSPIIKNCIFSNNIATTGFRAVGGPPGQGNALPPEDGGPASQGLYGLIYPTGGIAGGAAYYSHPSDAYFINCTFTDNKAYEVAWLFDPIYDLYGVENISAYTVGGALYSEGFNIVNINTCDFIDNLGGAIYCDSGCTVDINNTYNPSLKCQFAGNSETSDGGAIYIDAGGTLNIQSCAFGGNSAYDDGGALKCRSNATLTDCSFNSNRADSDDGGDGKGGAVDAYDPHAIMVLDFNNCSFVGNQALYGGGFSSMDSDVNFTDCYFINNTAQEGGGLNLANVDLTVIGGAVKGNSAAFGYGGGLMCSVTKTEIRDCIIIDNFAGGTGNGGAINLYGGYVTHLVKNCLITGNAATGYGGGISCELWATPEIQNCTFSGNSAGDYGGAIFSDFGSDPQITDSIFENCNSHAIHEEDFGGDALVTYSLFYGNPDGDYYDSETGITYSGPGQVGSIPGGVANLYGDPLFVAGPLGDYYLSQTAAGQVSNSPAIDNGSDTAVNLALDTYTTRTDNVGDAGQVDRGYHYVDSTEVGFFQLTTSVVGGQGTIEPASGPYHAGTFVTLTAKPDAGWRLKAWSGTDNDASFSTTNSVFMNSDRNVTVEFEQPRTLRVEVGGGEPGYYSTIQDAISDAKNGDTIIVYPGIYYAAYIGTSVYIDKSITIMSLTPSDPTCVENTIIDGFADNQFNEGFTNLGVTFGPLADSNTVLNGFTIQNCGGYWDAVGEDGSRQQNHPDGYDGSPGYGAAVQILLGGGPVIKNCVIRNNVVIGGYGGDGVIATGPPASLNAGRGGWGGFAWGGAVYCDVNTSPTFINCQIIDNTAIGGNGGDGGDGVVNGGWPNYGGNWSMRGTPEAYVYLIDPFTSDVYYVTDGDLWELLAWDYALSAYLSFGWGNGISFLGDYRWYSGYGGGVFCYIGSNVTFIDCEISGNIALGGMSGQGGIFPDRPIEPLVPYEIPSFGGGVYCAAESTVTFTGCTIKENIASPPTLVDVNDPNSGLRFSIHPYLGHGGGVCAEDTATVIFNNCSFEENDASLGGGLKGANANLQISDCNFVSNSAFHGGGVFEEHGPVSILRSNFTDNIALSDANDPNVLGTGGGLHFSAAEVDVIDCNINGNQADASGGGVYFEGEGISSLTNCLITNNTSGRDGGGVSANIFTQLTISNCTIADNTVTGVRFPETFGGGLYVSDYSNVSVIDSIIWDNVAINGTQVAVGSGFEYYPRPSTVNVSYSDIGPAVGWPEFEDSEPFWDDWDQNDGATLVDSEAIYDQFSGGSEWAEVIISLFEPVELRETTDWSSPASVAILRAEIDSRQNSVLSTLTPAEFTLRHRLENQAGFSGEVTIGGLNKLRNNSLVAYIEPVRYVYRMLAQAHVLANVLGVREQYDGTGIAIAIVDDGVDYTHPRLGGGGFPNAKVIGGYDTADNDADPMHSALDPEAGHGTCCTGIAAGNLGTFGDYIGGVAPGAKIYALKIWNDEGVSPTDADLAAWDWCVTHAQDDPENPILAISNSWGIYGFPFNDTAAADALFPALAVAADTANAAGITVLASSGNDGFAGEGISWPSAMSKVISVGAVFDTTDQVTGYSNTADILDILAPADPIYTTDMVGPAGYDVGSYFPEFAGTSAACPYAAGAVATIQSAAMAEWGDYFTPEQVKTLLTIGVPVTDTKVDITKPRINVAMAISYLMASPIYVEEGCTFVGWDPNTVEVGYWDPNFIEYANISENPLFVEGYLLSQTESGQEENSPCVDTGSDLAGNLGLSSYTTRTDRVFDKGAVDMGYHQPLALAESCRISDLYADEGIGVINFQDFAIFVRRWLEEDCNSNDPNAWCAGTDLTFNTYVDWGDLMFFSECWLVEDTLAPVPNPSEWEVEPFSTSTTAPYSISMTAKTAIDGWTRRNVEYYFECTYGGGDDSGWQTDPTYEDLDLVLGTEYGYRVRARDTSLYQNMTDWSVEASAVVGEEEDHNPPEPDPMTWADPSYTAMQNSITLFATTAIDDTAGVEYYFENFDTPGVNSGWINIPEWTDVGLTPNTMYTYRVQARDTSPWQNETDWSDELDVTTLDVNQIEDLNAPTPDPNIEDVNQYYDVNDGYYHHYMVCTECTDESGVVEYYFDCYGHGGFDSGWIAENTWDVAVSVNPQRLAWRVRARDLFGNLTLWSEWEWIPY